METSIHNFLKLIFFLLSLLPSSLKKMTIKGLFIAEIWNFNNFLNFLEWLLENFELNCPQIQFYLKFSQKWLEKVGISGETE